MPLSTVHDAATRRRMIANTSSNRRRQANLLPVPLSPRARLRPSLSGATEPPASAPHAAQSLSRSETGSEGCPYRGWWSARSGGRCGSAQLALTRKIAPPRGGELPKAGGALAAGRAGGVGSLPLSRCATAPPRGEQLDRTARALRGGCQGVNEEGSPAPQRGRPPSAFGLSPRFAEGEGISTC